MTDQPPQSPLPPPLVMMQLLFGKQLTYSLSGVARLGVADHMNGKPQPVEAIAAKAGAHAPSLYRVMRMLASFGVFKEGPQRHFALTPVGDLLKTDVPGSLRYMAMMFGEEFSTRAYEHIAECLRSGGDGVTEAYGKHDLGGAGRAPRAMRDLSAGDDQLHLGRGGRDRRGLRFFRHRAPRRCRRRARPAARRDPARQSGMQGVLFDRPEVVAHVPKQQFAGCEGRITTEAGSFFERVPDGCDAYLLKHIIHDWSDEHCRTILGLMREKLPKHGRVLVCEMVVSDEPGPTPAKLLDIEMLVMTVGGKERTPEEFRELFASSRLAAQPHRCRPTARSR